MREWWKERAETPSSIQTPNREERSCMSRSYTRYAWVGNRISSEDMAKLYAMKKAAKRPITVLVAEAIKIYLETKKEI